MIKISARGIASGINGRLIGRVAIVPTAGAERQDSVRVFPSTFDATETLDGYLAVVGAPDSLADATSVPTITGCDVAHLEEGDVVSVDSLGQVKTLYRKSSKHNSLFATDRCNSLCLMCSQPPREVDETGRVEELIRLTSLMDPRTESLGITGGEPTLLGTGLLDVISVCRDVLPQTSLHLLSNGRRFSYPSYAGALGAIAHPDLMVGIPLYSDIDAKHDYVVQARNAFDETVIGLHNLAQAGVSVEIRIVVHRETFDRLPQLARYIYRNLTFTSHVAFMGLEMIGFAKTNQDKLWMDPLDYASMLEEAVLFLAAVGMTVSIYNHQLCTLPTSVRPFSRQSISDWKNEFAAECDACTVKKECGGFFAWNLKGHRSRGICPV